MIHPSVEQFTKAMTFAGVADCPQDGHWQIPTDSDICTEVETIALVFGFVRALRPNVVMETGCNVGCMAQAITAALEANDQGYLYTCDIEQKFITATVERRLPRCWVIHCEGLYLLQHHCAPDLYFIDSGVESRGQELAWLKEHGKKGAVVLVHDTSCYEYLNKMVREFPSHVILPGPRGLGVITL